MITDGTFVCAACGEWRTGCNLCGVAVLMDCRDEIARKSREEFEAERELSRQERAIRRGANDRNYTQTSDNTDN